MIKKYILMGGFIESRTDGDFHFVSAYQLCELYGFNKAECYFADERMPETYLGLPKDLPVLGPRYDWRYAEVGKYIRKKIRKEDTNE